MKTPPMLLGVMESRSFPVGVVHEFVAKHSRSTQREREALAIGGIRRGRSISNQHPAIAERLFHPGIARIKTGQRPGTFRIGAKIGHRRVGFPGLSNEEIELGFSLKTVAHRLRISKVRAELIACLGNQTGPCAKLRVEYSVHRLR